MEIWKPISCFKEVRNPYWISNLGRVKNKHGKIMKLQPDKDGYFKKVFYIEQIDNKKRTESYLIHRLVAMHFIENTDNLEYVHHLNGNNQDNRVENLKWINRKELEMVIKNIRK